MKRWLVRWGFRVHWACSPALRHTWRVRALIVDPTIRADYILRRPFAQPSPDRDEWDRAWAAVEREAAL